jgi:Holliday junction resolvase RusA-like endonuclease
VEVKLTVPSPGNVLARIPIAVTVEPLSRPRVNYYSKNMYQPLKNQAELRNCIEKFGFLEQIKDPCIVSVVVNWEKLNSKFEWPVTKNHGDVDNLCKAVLDGLVDRSILKDDRIVVETRICKAWGDLDFCYIEIYDLAKPEYIYITP